ncbi:MAG: phosphoribosylformylglycinamidine cyclo-ligase [Candidatus Omnitrophica bacterium]|nr:phosphoribosylformylglycinamidine cyclo-ligase [Candidatus Omnitrophota bacterium]
MKTMTYEKAGVPHLKGDPVYNRKIAGLIRSTHIPGVLGSPTGFAALFDPGKVKIQNPLLVASTDGVGTKLEVARLQGRHDTIGIDLVAMCVNDIITCGAKPVFFLDYIATGKFRSKAVGEILKGITAGCREAGCALIGGETAIMPGFYGGKEIRGVPQYDVAGFSVGLVDRRKVISGKNVRSGDVLLGLASSGFHSNGYSLLRKIFPQSKLSGKIGLELLKPTRIYVKPMLAVISKLQVKGIVNITGGGFIDNLPRVIPGSLGAKIRKNSWLRPKIFDLAQDFANISDFEMLRTFNCGIGMVFILRLRDVPKAQKILKQHSVSSWVIGDVIRGRAVEVI